MPPGAILQIEGNPYPDVESGLQKWLKEPSRKTGWLFRTLARYEVPINVENMTMLASLAEHHAEPEVADHFVVLSGAQQLLHWFDAPSDPIYVAGCVEEATVARFADRLGAQIKKEAGSSG